jgi:hypothetical protein
MLEMAVAGPQILWQSIYLRGGIASPVLVNGYLYGIDWSHDVGNFDWDAVNRLDWPLVCIDWKTGTPKWTISMKMVSLMAADGKLIMIEPKGVLHIAEATPEGYKELSSADVLGGAGRPRLFVTAPVLCGGRIYCRNYAGDLVCIDVSK